MTTAETTQVERRLVLADDADRATLDRYAAERGWSLVNTAPWSFDGAEQRTWAVTDDTEVLYGEFHGTGGRTVSVYAAPEVVDRLADDLRAVLPTVDLDAVFATLTAEPHPPATETLRALRALRLACMVIGDPPEAARDDRLLDAFSRVVGHPDRVVRLVAVITAADLVAHRPDLTERVLPHRDDNADDPHLASLFEAFEQIAAHHAAASG